MSNLWEEGNAHFDKGNFQEALKCYQELLKENSDDPAVLEKIGDTYFKLEKYSEAFKKYNEVLKSKENLGLNEKLVKTFSGFGDYLIDKGYYQDAARYYEAAYHTFITKIGYSLERLNEINCFLEKKVQALIMQWKKQKWLNAEIKLKIDLPRAMELVEPEFEQKIKSTEQLNHNKLRM